MTLDKPTLEDFTPLVGQPGIQIADLAVELVEAVRIGESPNPLRGDWGFSLIFTGPPQPAAAQGIYPVTVPGFGVLELFVAAVMPDVRWPGRQCYQVIFN